MFVAKKWSFKSEYIYNSNCSLHIHIGVIIFKNHFRSLSYFSAIAFLWFEKAAPIYKYDNKSFWYPLFAVLSNFFANLYGFIIEMMKKINDMEINTFLGISVKEFMKNWYPSIFNQLLYYRVFECWVCKVICWFRQLKICVVLIL